MLLAFLASPLRGAPQIFFSNLQSGPNRGGENNNGVYVTVYGKGFGVSRNGSYITVGGGNVVNYLAWSDTLIAFQLGAASATGNIVVRTSAGASNGVPFTVRSGNVYFVSRAGSDRNPGTADQPFRTLAYAAGNLQAGDTLYVRGGTYAEVVYIGNSGSAAAPIVMAGYPGETAVVDGGYVLPAGAWDPLVVVSGAYVIVSNLIIQNSYGMGLYLGGAHAQATGVTAQLNMENGIFSSGSYDVIQGSTAYYNAKSNEFGSRTRGYWAGGINAANHPVGIVMRRNVIWDNWGEGLSLGRLDHATVEDNIVYDNWAANVYLTNVRYVLFQRNLVYSTAGNVCQSGDQPGLELADEYVSSFLSSDNTIVNNLFLGSKWNLFWWHEDGNTDGLVRDLIAYNTFADASQNGNIVVGAGGTHSGTRFENNIILQEDSVPIADTGDASGITFGFNGWSRTPPYGVSGTGDVLGDPQLAKTGSIGPGQLNPNWFKISSTSPAISRATALSQVTDDFFGTARGSQPDIGAEQHAAASGPGFDFSLAASPASLSVKQGAAASSALAAELVSGVSQAVSFAVSGLPAGVSASFAAPSCSPTCSSTLTLQTSAGTPAGVYSLNVTASGGGASHSTGLSLTVASAVSTGSGPVAWWTFDEAAGTVAGDASGNSNRATLNGGAGWSTGVLGGALSLDGSSGYAGVAQSASLDLTTALTVAFWISPHAISPVIDARILDKNYSWNVKLNSVYPQLSSAGRYAKLANAVTPGQWQHVAFTFSSGTVKGYFNGVPVSLSVNTFAPGNTLPLMAWGLSIGVDADRTSYYNGMIDDLRIYNRALSDSEIASLYNLAAGSLPQ